MPPGPEAASSCISVADAGGQAVSLEVTPDGVGELEPQAGLLAHTNHCLAEMTCAGERALDPASSSVPRFDRASELLTRQRGALDPAALALGELVGRFVRQTEDGYELTYAGEQFVGSLAGPSAPHEALAAVAGAGVVGLAGCAGGTGEETAGGDDDMTEGTTTTTGTPPTA